MGQAAERVGVGSKLLWDGELVEITELRPGPGGTDLAVKAMTGNRSVFRVALRDVLFGTRARVVPTGDGPSSNDPGDPATIIVSNLTRSELAEVRTRANHVREVMTGYRSGIAEMADEDEPHPRYDPSRPLTARYRAKAEELGVGLRTIELWVRLYKTGGEAGLARQATQGVKSTGRVHEAWVDVAAEVMAEHTDLSRPSRTRVIDLTNARVVARFGDGVVPLPSRATAFRVLSELEKRNPLFRLSTKRTRDVAGRPEGPYGKLRPTRPGEYVLMDSTRLDVFGMDPATLRWTQAELTVAMCWCTRCIIGLRVTPVSTKAVDAATVLFQAFRPPPAGKDWPEYAVWPEHGVPRSVLLDPDAFDPAAGTAHPAIVPETLVVDHGKIYVSEHLTSTCQRMGISIQPARLRTGRDKGPVERFFRTIREDLLQALPGFKGADVWSRGESPESEAFFFLNELEDIIREWVAVVYHHRPHHGLVDPHLPAVQLSPAAMYEREVARSGFIEAPRDPDLGLEFLATAWRTIQHYGVEYHGRRYDGAALNPYRNCTSPYTGPAKGRWPFQVHPDDITRIWFRDPNTRTWHQLVWEHAAALTAPLSDEAFRYARTLAATRYKYPDDKLAMADLLERWNLGLGDNRAERRMALRLAREDNELLGGTSPAQVTDLPSVARVLRATATDAKADDPVRRDVRSGSSQQDFGGEEATSATAPPESPEVGGGDDDEFDDLDLDDFYADALTDVEP